MTHKGEGQNVLHIGGDVQWYSWRVTKNSDPIYLGVPDSGSGLFVCVDEYESVWAKEVTGCLMSARKGGYLRL